MPARVRVRAVIWVGDRIVVHRRTRRGRPHVTLPGGRVNERESVTDALRREVREEVLPPVLDRLTGGAGADDGVRWLGNLYTPGENPSDV